MAADFDGWKIAEQRIAREAEARTGTLDLAGLGLEEIPKAVAGLTHLRELRLGWPDIRYEPPDDVGWGFDPEDNGIKDLTPVSFLTALLALDCTATKVADLTPLTCLPGLESLDCSATNVIDLTPIANLTALRSLFCSGTEVADLTPIASLTSLQSLHCFSTKVANLRPLARLTALEEINCSETQVADLTPIAQFTALRWLDCRSTAIVDFGPLADLTALEAIYCSDTQVADLTPLARLTALQLLWCEQTEITDLAPLAGLTALQSLDCSYTQVADLAPLAGLTALQSLNCAYTPVAELAPLAGLTALQSLFCSSTQVADLAPLAGLTALQSLFCSSTQVADLAPLLAMASLHTLDASRLALKSLDARWAEPGRLDKFVLYGTSIPDIPAGVLSSGPGEDFLPSLRAYFEDSRSDDARLEDVKLMLLGNGRVGKTQLARALRGEPFQPDSRSTHGVTIDKLDLPRGKNPPIPLHIWDFGGQDIYHGTHALFLRDHAIFALVWAREFETASPEREHELFGDRPLRYWVDYVRRAGGKNRAAVVVQTRCDSPRDGAVCPVPEADLRDAFGEVHRVEFSAKTPRGLDALRAALAEAAAFALNQEGAPKIPAAWARVKAALEAMRAEDRARPEAERRHRVVATEDFEALCRAEGVKSEPKHLLNYLHRSGVVFYRPELMNRIVLDQAWALEAIYALFEREGGAYKRIRGARGRFTLADLTSTAWRGREDDERALFLDMMRAYGVGFRLDRRGPKTR